MIRGGGRGGKVKPVLGGDRFTRATLEFGVRGLILVVLGVVLGVADALSGGIGRAIADALIGAALFGAWTYWSMRRGIGAVLAGADATSNELRESLGETQYRVLYQALPVLAVVVVVDVLFRNSTSVAGIPLGSGLALLLARSRMVGWERANRAVLLHQARRGMALRIGFSTGWLEPSEYRLEFEARAPHA